VSDTELSPSIYCSTVGFILTILMFLLLQYAPIASVVVNDAGGSTVFSIDFPSVSIMKYLFLLFSSLRQQCCRTCFLCCNRRAFCFFISLASSGKSFGIILLPHMSEQSFPILEYKMINYYFSIIGCSPICPIIRKTINSHLF
jgi:hypothetical protein